MSLQNDIGMFQTTSLLRWRNVACAIGLFVLYYAWKVVYRLYLSPLSHVPGRKLAGMSNNIQNVFFRLGSCCLNLKSLHHSLVPLESDLNFVSRIEPLRLLS